MRTPEEIQAEIQATTHAYVYAKTRIDQLTAELEAAEAATPKPWPKMFAYIEKVRAKAAEGCGK